MRLDFLISHSILESLLHLLHIFNLMLLSLILLHISCQSMLIKTHTEAISHSHGAIHRPTHQVLLILGALHGRWGELGSGSTDLCTSQVQIIHLLLLFKLCGLLRRTPVRKWWAGPGRSSLIIQSVGWCSTIFIGRLVELCWHHLLFFCHANEISSIDWKGCCCLLLCCLSHLLLSPSIQGRLWFLLCSGCYDSSDLVGLHFWSFDTNIVAR